MAAAIDMILACLLLATEALLVRDLGAGFHYQPAIEVGNTVFWLVLALGAATAMFAAPLRRLQWGDAGIEYRIGTALRFSIPWDGLRRVESFGGGFWSPGAGIRLETDGAHRSVRQAFSFDGKSAIATSFLRIAAIAHRNRTEVRDPLGWSRAKSGHRPGGDLQMVIDRERAWDSLRVQRSIHRVGFLLGLAILLRGAIQSVAYEAAVATCRPHCIMFSMVGGDDSATLVPLGLVFLMVVGVRHVRLREGVFGERDVHHESSA